MNKQGMWRIVEAIVASLLIMGTFLVFLSGENVAKQNNIFDSIRSGLDEIAKDNELRKDILNGVNVDDEIENKIKEVVGRPNFNYLVEICDFGLNGCGCSSNCPDYSVEEVYSDERIISATTDSSGNPKIVRVYVWNN
jgi:hypothetical protein